MDVTESTHEDIFTHTPATKNQVLRGVIGKSQDKAGQRVTKCVHRRRLQVYFAEKSVSMHSGTILRTLRLGTHIVY